MIFHGRELREILLDHHRQYLKKLNYLGRQIVHSILIMMQLWNGYPVE
jgi:hypothetical protein